MNLGVTKTQFDFMEANGMNAEGVVVLEEKPAAELTLEAIHDLRVKTEKELETAPEEKKGFLRQFLSRIRRQEKAARRYL